MPAPTADAADLLAIATETWRRLVPAMAAGRSMRVARDGRSFGRRGQRPVTDALPNQPAALLIYDHQGCAPIFCLDLDTSRGLVDQDFTILTGLLDQAGCSWFSDHSPNGGRHIYMPLATSVALHQARAVTTALTHHAPTLDQLPMTNIAAGCIRPPGARHRTGGHQVLDGPIEDAEAILAAPNSPPAWRRLLALLSIEDNQTPAATPPVASPISTLAAHQINGPTQPHLDLALSGQVAELEALPALPGYHHPDASYQAIARTGDFDTSRYASPSEARQGVVWAAVASGWTFSDLVRRLEDGTWPGLASFYARYSHRHHHQAVTRDWLKAVRFEKRRRQSAGGKPVRTSTTSPQKTQGGYQGATSKDDPVECRPPGHLRGNQANQHVRSWLTAADLLHGPDSDLAVRLVLRALAEAAALTHMTTVEHGNRSLAIATGLNQATVGRILQRLLTEPLDRALVDLVRPARGVRAQTLALRIPALLRPACERRPWRRGRIHALRPAFRELGRPAAFVYEALEQLHGPADSRTIARTACVGSSATAEALTVLASWGLAARTVGGWTIGAAQLSQLAEAWGITDEIRTQIERYRTERIQWQLWLSQHGLLAPTNAPADRAQTRPPEVRQTLETTFTPTAPPDADESLLKLLNRVLGAQDRLGFRTTA